MVWINLSKKHVLSLKETPMKALLLFLLPLFLYAKCTYDLNLDFDLKQQTLKVNANVKQSEKSLTINLNGFNIKNKEALTKQLLNGANHLQFSYTLTNKNINQDFIYLLDNWYPKVNELCMYTITTNLPTIYKTIFEKTNKVISHATFIASPNYTVHSKEYNHITISTYFFKNNTLLATKYLNKTIDYIKLYEKLIGKFPFKVFNIVENHATTGYSLPTYTLVGSYLLNKPYLLNQSLGHEILHQYFGNAIFSDPRKGNYAEGLVTHLADNYYKKQQNKQIQNRKNSLLQFDTFVTKEYPANQFTHRIDKNSMAIGYTKVAYIFDMLEEKLGTKKFFEILQSLYKEKAFRLVNLEDLTNYFQNHSKEDLEPFFKQWFYKEGRVQFQVNNIKKSYHRGSFKITFTLQQKEPFSFELPLEIKTYDGTINKKVHISKKEQELTVHMKSEPLSISFDNKLSLFRTLFKEEYPLNIGALLKEKKLLMVMDEKDQSTYKNIQKIFPHGKIVFSKDLKFSDVKNASVLFLNQRNTLLQHFLPRLNIPKESSFLTLRTNTFNTQKLFAVLHSQPKLQRSFFMLKHYANYQTIIIKDKNIVKKLDATQNGFTHTFSQQPAVSIIKKPTRINDIAKEIGDAKVIYATESHTNMSHHLNQLRIIKALVDTNKDVTIAMEMFQKPFQQALDDYIANKTDLNTFLKQSQYYKRWKFNYDYYKPILDYAKAKNIKVIGINIDRKIVREVNKKGLLHIKEKSKLPNKIDQSNITYKNNLAKIFKEHKFDGTEHGKKTTNPYSKEFFFQSQLVWDEAMAENIVNYTKKHPKKTVVVLVGSGHVQNHYGIPARVFEDTKLPYRVILNNVVQGLENDIILRNTNEVKIKESPKLGVFLSIYKKLTVTDVIKDSFGEKVGLQKDDVILKFNKEAVHELADLKRLLYFLDSFKNVTLTIKRNNEELTLTSK